DFFRVQLVPPCHAPFSQPFRFSLSVFWKDSFPAYTCSNGLLALDLFARLQKLQGQERRGTNPLPAKGFTASAAVIQTTRQRLLFLLLSLIGPFSSKSATGLGWESKKNIRF